VNGAEGPHRLVPRTTWGAGAITAATAGAGSMGMPGRNSLGIPDKDLTLFLLSERGNVPRLR
jgi:hypothetical protein